MQGTVFGVAPPRRGSRGPGPSDLPGPDRLLHGALVRREATSLRFSSATSGSFSTARRRSPRTDGSSWRGPISRSSRRTSRARSTWAGSFPSTRSPRACSSGRSGPCCTASSPPTPTRLPTSCPSELRRRRDLLPVAAAYRAVHFPERLEDVEAARRRFAFEDFFVLQVGLTLRRRRQAREEGRPLAPPGRSSSGSSPTCPSRSRRRSSASRPRSGRTWRARADEPPPAGRRRLRQDDRGASSALLAAVESGYQARAHGADRDPGRAALPDARAAARRAARRSSVAWLSGRRSARGSARRALGGLADRRRRTSASARTR